MNATPDDIEAETLAGLREIALKGKEARFVKTERGKFAANA